MTIRKTYYALALAAALSGCTTVQVHQTGQTLQRTEIDAELLFQAVVAANSAAVSAGRMSSATANAYDLKAWDALQAARAGYAAGQTVDLTVLNAQAAAAKAGKPQ